MLGKMLCIEMFPHLKDNVAVGFFIEAPTSAKAYLIFSFIIQIFFFRIVLSLMSAFKALFKGTISKAQKVAGREMKRLKKMSPQVIHSRV